MADKITDILSTLNLDYRELGIMGFDPVFIEDYLNSVRNSFILANEAQIDRDNIVSNTERLDIAEPKIQSNINRLNLLEPRVTQNEADIAQNVLDIQQVNDDLDTHEALTSAHGVTGNNVGTGDYCTLSAGGVVNLAALVADLTQITTADIGAAPAAYDQVYTQLVTDLTNENKAKINEIVLKINAILSGQITAKQMSDV